ncbi:MAG: hypothetical protein IKE60_26485 [Reyranella sp.]|uniref:hypothetical protein n=1 Tax=Reyranella sp. TaxID=1929291 RepID=UPI0026001800|nr:hypothetical protein [Reyranella sp.]MBR2818238.1 hypothetical protein [Reyranella sp.]
MQRADTRSIRAVLVVVLVVVDPLRAKPVRQQSRTPVLVEPVQEQIPWPLRVVVVEKGLWSLDGSKGL